MRRDLTFRHGIAEIACIGAHVGQSLLNLAARARDGVGDLIPILGLQLSGPVDLDEGETQALVCVSRSPGDRVQVAGCLGKTVKAVHTVCGELARDALDVGKVVDRAISVFLCGRTETLNHRIIDASEAQRIGEFIRRV